MAEITVQVRTLQGQKAMAILPRKIMVNATFESEGEGEVAVFSAKRWDRRSS